MSIKKEIEKNVSIIEVKKQAKLLLKSIKEKGEDSSLMLCKNKIAKEKGYLDWYDLYQSIKKEIENNSSINYLIIELIKNHKTNTVIKINHKQKNYEIFDHNNKIRLNYSKLSYSRFVSVLLNFIKEMNISVTKFENITDFTAYFEIEDVSIRCDIEIIDNNLEETTLILNVFKSEIRNKLEELGYNKNNSIQILNNIINNNILILGGCAGSGKSTALKAIIENYYNDEKYLKYMKFFRKNTNKILQYKEEQLFFDSIESPIESKIEGVNQKEIQSSIDFKKEIINSLRKKPELLLISEIRNPEIAQTISQMSNKNISLLSSIHASNIYTAIKRLKGLKHDIKIGTTIIYQELVKTICPHCSIKLNIKNPIDNVDNEYQKQLKFILENKPKANLSKISIDCAWSIKCNHTRTIVAESITINQKMKTLIDKNKYKELEEYINILREQQNYLVGKSFNQEKAEKVLKGKIAINNLYLE